MLPQQFGDGAQGGYLRFQDRGEVRGCLRSRGGLENPLTAVAHCSGRQTATYRAAGFAQRQSSHGLPPRYRGGRSAPPARLQATVNEWLPNSVSFEAFNQPTLCRSASRASQREQDLGCGIRHGLRIAEHRLIVKLALRRESVLPWQPRLNRVVHCPRTGRVRSRVYFEFCIVEEIGNKASRRDVRAIPDQRAGARDRPCRRRAAFRTFIFSLQIKVETFGLGPITLA